MENNSSVICPFCGEECKIYYADPRTTYTNKFKINHHIVKKHTRGMLFAGHSDLSLSFPAGDNFTISYTFNDAIDMYEQFIYINFIDRNEFGRQLRELDPDFGFYYDGGFIKMMGRGDGIASLVNNGKYKCCVRKKHELCDYVYEDGFPHIALVLAHVKRHHLKN